MKKTFDYYRSTNGRLHAALDNEDHYTRYLKRIQQIVKQKPRPDQSASQKMSFLNRCHIRSNNHRSAQNLRQINTENQILLDKIIGAKKRNPQKVQDRYMLAMHEKRFREQERISQQNKKIAFRVINQPATIRHRSKDTVISCKESPRRTHQKSFYESRIKERKLPQLLQVRA